MLWLGSTGGAAAAAAAAVVVVAGGAAGPGTGVGGMAYVSGPDQLGAGSCSIMRVDFF
jgi:hypothetical protein